MREPRLIFILVTVALDMIGIGLIIPSLPEVIRRFATDPAVISSYFGYFISVYALMQFVAAPLLGALSDVYGRRPVLLLSLFAAGVDYLMMAFAPTLFLLFVGRVISGLTGANITVAMAYIADVSDEKNRSSNFGLVGAAFGLGFIIGPVLGGFLGEIGPQYPFLFAALINLLNFLFGFFILPESLPENRRSPFVWTKINPLVSLRAIFRIPGVLALAGVHFLLQLAGQTHPSIWTLYTGHRFNWGPTQVGFSLAAVGILSAIAQGGLTRILIPRMGGESRAILICAAGNMVGFALFGLANEGWMLYAVLVVSSVFWVGQPALQAVLSRQVQPEEQGELQGSLVSLSSLAAILNPIITTQLFAHFTRDSGSQIPGAPYFFAAAMNVLAILILLRGNHEKR